MAIPNVVATLPRGPAVVPEGFNPDGSPQIPGFTGQDRSFALGQNTQNLFSAGGIQQSASPYRSLLDTQLSNEAQTASERIRGTGQAGVREGMDALAMRAGGLNSGSAERMLAAANAAQMQEQGALGKNVLGKRLEGEKQALQFGADVNKNELARQMAVAEMGNTYDQNRLTYDLGKYQQLANIWGSKQLTDAFAAENN